MTQWNLFPRSFLWFCTYTIFVDTTSQKLDQAFIIKAAENVIRHYYSNSHFANAASTGGDGFEPYLEWATTQTNEFIRATLDECQRAGTNCTHQRKCPGLAEIFLSFSNGSHLTPESFMKSLPMILNVMTSDNCSDEGVEDDSVGHDNRRPTVAQAWGYSFGFVTLVIAISNIGACLGPTMDKRFFRRILQFLVAMGAGSLVSTSLLVLLPEAFDMIVFVELEEYVWKATVVVISIYVFFCFERIMKTILYKRKKINRNLSIIIDEPDNNGVDDTSLTPLSKVKEQFIGHSHETTGAENAARQTMAWMVMIGDVIHNFVDGLSIGAAFSKDAALGVSISLAVVCEELPHELADIAVLLHSGMTIKKALLLNFLSACVCYLGMVIGVMVGNVSMEASKWIFAMAGGLFLYVPLVDMLPDMSAHVDTLLMTCKREARIVVFLHACGLIIGASIVIFIVNVSSYIVIY